MANLKTLTVNCLKIIINSQNKRGEQELVISNIELKRRRPHLQVFMIITQKSGERELML